MSGCAGKREQKGVRDCRGGLIGVLVERAQELFDVDEAGLADAGVIGRLAHVAVLEAAGVWYAYRFDYYDARWAPQRSTSWFAR